MRVAYIMLGLIFEEKQQLDKGATQRSPEENDEEDGDAEESEEEETKENDKESGTRAAGRAAAMTGGRGSHINLHLLDDIARGHWRGRKEGKGREGV